MRRPAHLALAALVTALLAATGPVAAATPDEMLTRLDADGDGAVSREEFLALRKAMFLRIDADGDGFVTAAEIEAARQSASADARRDKRIWQQDGDGDGRLSLAEYTSQTRGFDLADRDGDGALSRAELALVAKFLQTRAP